MSALLSASWLTPGLVAALMFGLAAGICSLILAVLLKTGLAARIALDHPNERSLHSSVIPRCGGWGIMATLLVFLAASLPLMWQLSVALALLAGISFIDDRRGLSARVRLVFQALAISIVLIVQVGGMPWWLQILVALGWLWLTNLYNFMDGSDGLAGLMTLIGFGSLAIALGSSAPLLMMVSVAASGAALGFLFFNWAPARIFLGDVGSIPLGFLAGALGFLGWRHGSWGLWLPILVFSPFIADASATLIKRVWRHEKIWQAHREHYYQRLIQAGVPHRETSMIYGAAMLIAGLLAVVLRDAGLELLWPALGLWILALAACGIWIERRVRTSATKAAA